MIVLVVVMLVLAGCGGGTTDSHATSSETPRTSMNQTHHIDFSNLTTYTYTSNASSYSIQYPATWEVNDGVAYGPNISVISPASRAGLYMGVIENVSQSYTLNQATAEYLRRLQSNENVNTSVLNRETVTLPSGQSARRVDLRTNGYSMDRRRIAVITLVDNTIYIAMILMPENAYTTTGAHHMDEILGSLTVRGGSSSNHSATETHSVPREVALARAPAPRQQAGYARPPNHCSGAGG